jgi:peptidyl-dipeptidase Dcp
LHQFRGDAQFYTWLYRIAVNTAKKQLMVLKRDPLVFAPDNDQDAEDETSGVWREPRSHGNDAETPEALLASREIAAAVNAAKPFDQPSAQQYLAPDFAAIKDEHYGPAFEEGMKQHTAEIRAIADNAEPATFENTIVAMEKSGAVLQRVAAVFFGLSSAHTNETIQAVQVEMAPKLAAHEDGIYLDGPLFARVKSLHDARDTLGLDAESARLLERSYKAFVRAGAELDEAGKARLREINARESSLTTEFSNKLLAATNANAVVVDSAEALKGFSEGEIAAAAAAAKAMGQDGKWAITLQNTTRQPARATWADQMKS